MSQVQPPAYENLPTDGPFGKEPAVSVGTLMSLATMIVAALSMYGISVSPELQQFADQYGTVIAGFVIIAIPFVQGVLTRARVYAPASVQALLMRK